VGKEELLPEEPLPVGGDPDPEPRPREDERIAPRSPSVRFTARSARNARNDRTSAASSFHRPNPPRPCGAGGKRRFRRCPDSPRACCCVPSLTTARIRAEGNAARSAWKAGVERSVSPMWRSMKTAIARRSLPARLPGIVVSQLGVLQEGVHGVEDGEAEPERPVEEPRRRTYMRKKVNGGRKRRSNAVPRAPFFRSSAARGSSSGSSLDEVGGVHVGVVQQVPPEGAHRPFHPDHLVHRAVHEAARPRRHSRTV